MYDVNGDGEDDLIINYPINDGQPFVNYGIDVYINKDDKLVKAKNEMGTIQGTLVFAEKVYLNFHMTGQTVTCRFMPLITVMVLYPVRSMRTRHMNRELQMVAMADLASIPAGARSMMFRNIR